MGFSEVVLLIRGLIQFPGAVLQLIKFLQGTPEEHRESAAKAVGDAMDSFEKTGRPQW